MRDASKPFADVQRTKHYQVYFCGHCPHAHIVFFNESNKAVAVATLGAQQVRDIVERIELQDPNYREDILL